MKKIIIFLLFINLMGCSNKQKNESNRIVKPVIDTVRYNYKGFNNGFSLDLYSNKHFKYQYYAFGCTGGGERQIVIGTYKKFLKHKKLLLVPDTVKIYNYPFVNRFRSKIKPKIFPYYAGRYRIKTEYDLVKWAGKEYLLSPLRDNDYKAYNYNSESPSFEYELLYRNDYYAFAEAYNDDLESVRYLKCLSRKIDEHTDNSYADLCKSVGKWKFLFLEKPIRATVLKTTQIKKKIRNFDGSYETYYKYNIILNKGLKDKVYIGLKFFRPNDGDYATVERVNDNTCVVHSSNYYMRKGKIMSTKSEYQK